MPPLPKIPLRLRVDRGANSFSVVDGDGVVLVEGWKVGVQLHGARTDRWVELKLAVPAPIAEDASRLSISARSTDFEIDLSFQLRCQGLAISCSDFLLVYGAQNTPLVQSIAVRADSPGGIWWPPRRNALHATRLSPLTVDRSATGSAVLRPQAPSRRLALIDHPLVESEDLLRVEDLQLKGGWVAAAFQGLRCRFAVRADWKRESLGFSAILELDNWLVGEEDSIHHPLTLGAGFEIRFSQGLARTAFEIARDLGRSRPPAVIRLHHCAQAPADPTSIATVLCEASIRDFGFQALWTVGELPRCGPWSTRFERRVIATLAHVFGVESALDPPALSTLENRALRELGPRLRLSCASNPADGVYAFRVDEDADEDRDSSLLWCVNTSGSCASVPLPVERCVGLGAESAGFRDLTEEGTEIHVTGAFACVIEAHESRLLCVRTLHEEAGSSQRVDPEDETKGIGLALDQPFRNVLVLRWTRHGVVAAGEHEELAKARASIAAGAHLVVAGPTGGPGAPLPVPEAVEDLCAVRFGYVLSHHRGESPLRRCGVQALGPEPWRSRLDDQSAADLGASDEGTVLFAPPRERSLTVILAPGDEPLVQRWVDALADRERAEPLHEQVSKAWRACFRTFRRDERIDAAFGQRDLAAQDFRAIGPMLEIGSIDAETYWCYRIESGGAPVDAVARSAERWLRDRGRLVRGNEQFFFERRMLGDAALVLCRRTAPQDFGRVLRVHLDDEDLGVWRLGRNGRVSRWGVDFFRIEPSLFPGNDADSRRQIRFTLQPEPAGTEVGSFRYRLLAEPCDDVAHLSSWDPESLVVEAADFDEEEISRSSAPPAGEARNAPVRTGRNWCPGWNVDADPRGEPLASGDRLFLRGWSARVPFTVVFGIPAGYRWFDALVGADPATSRAAKVRFRVLVNDREVFVSRWLCSGDAAVPARAALAAPCRLTLRSECSPDETLGGFQPPFANILRPVLLRELRPRR